MKKYLLLLVTFLFACDAMSQTWQDTIASIEKLFARYKASSPGSQLAISRNGQVIYSSAWGMADLEHNIPLTKESIIEAGSVSKQFTAAAILLLEQQGKLSLDDDVRKYVPEVPDYGKKITLRQMMQHTSGLKDWGSIADIAGWPRSTKTYNNDDALYIISKQKTLNNIPGDEYLYSNSNYNLFAIIVERVSGSSLARFTRINIFESAGMKHTEWRSNFKKVVPNRAIAYSKSTDAYFTDMPNEYVYGNGGLLTTAEDLLIWNNYYLNGKLGNPSLLSKQLATTPLNNGVMNPYAAGLRVDSVRGWRLINHSGATAGYRANLQHFPDLGLSVAWLSNTSEFDRDPDITNAVSMLFVKDITASNRRNDPTLVTVPVQKLNSYEGWYRNPNTGMSVKLFIKDGKLGNSRGGNLIPVTENTFILGQNRVEIQPGNKKLLFISPFGTASFMAVDSAKLDATTMTEYTGEYYSEEAEVTCYLLIKDGNLVILRKPKSEMTLTPAYKDGFYFPPGDIHFERDKNNKIVSMRVFTGRARNVEFKKIK
jgi:CubicO group peptidase (beta-lactamase class C family)